MRSIILLAAVSAVALAKPGTYRETEDFQYERSATGEGTKAGFYGAQRGNVGGNYERAHNMDGLAQKQLGDAVRNVQGELGDTNHVGRGNVYTAANTRSAYGQKYLNTGNLEDRNLQEGSSLVSNSQTSGRQFSSSQNTKQYPSYNPDYRKGYSSYQQNAQTNAFGSEGSSQTLQAANHEASERQRGYNVRDQERESLAYTGSEYKGQGAYDYSHKSRSQSQREEQSAYGSNSETSFVGGAQRTENAYGSTAQTRLNGGGPVRISIRPGSSITIPFRAEKVDDNHRRFDANSINTDTEVLGKPGLGQQTNSKNYESSYRYNKAWKKHDSNPAAAPLAIPTDGPYPEIYATGTHDKIATAAQHGKGSTKTRYNGYNAASGSQSRYESGYNAEDHQQSYGTNSNANKNSQNILGTNGAVTNVDEGTQDSTPKNYQSKYSYHKSWERQGDPYVIVPASGDNADGQSQSLINSQHQGYRSQNYNSHASHVGYTKTGQVEECDDHSRIRRSNPLQKRQEVDPYHQIHQYDGQVSEQQQQVEWSSLEDLGQKIQTQHDFVNLESFTHQSENKSGKPYKLQKPSSVAQTQSVQQSKLEDFDQQQQVQTSWDNLEQQVENKWDNLENLGQQTQTLEEFGQQLENQWSNSENSSHHNGLHTLHTGSGSNLESFSHQSENKSGKPDKLQKPSSAAQTQSVQQGKLEDFDQQQQVQTSWDNLEQQVENKWDNLENLGQQTQKFEEFVQQLENQWSTDKLQKPLSGAQTQSVQQGKLEDLDQQQQVQTSWDNLGQEVENKWDNLENLGQQTQKLDNFGQQLETQWSNSENSGYHHGLHTLHTGSASNLESFSHPSEPDKIQKPLSGAQTQSVQQGKLEDFDQKQQVQTGWDNLEQQVENKWDNLENLGQQTQKLEEFGQQLENQWSTSENSSHHNVLHTLHTSSGSNLESFSHQSENNWSQPDKLQKPLSGAQTQSVQQGKLEDLDQQQQVQTSWDNLGQEVENKWDNLENLGQQTQKLDNFGQQLETQWSNSENSGYHHGLHTLHTGSASNIESFSHPSEPDKLQKPSSGAQTLSIQPSKLEGLDQQEQVQTSWDNLGQQAEYKWNNLENVGQQTLNLENFGQHAENQRSNSENSGYHHGHTYTLHTGSGPNLESFSHQSENKWGKPDKLHKPSPGAQTLSIQQSKLEDLDQQQQVQTGWDNLGQQAENKWNNLENVGEQTPKLENFGQHAENQRSNSENSGYHHGHTYTLHTGSGPNLESFSHQSEDKWGKPDKLQKPSPGAQTLSIQQSKLEDLDQQQQVQTSWDNLGQQTENVGQQTQDLDNLGQQTVNFDTIRTEGHQNGWHTLHTGSGNQWKSSVDSDSLMRENNNEGLNNPGRDTSSSPNRGGGSLQSLWDKIDKMEQMTISSDSNHKHTSTGHHNQDLNRLSNGFQSSQNTQGSSYDQLSHGGTRYHHRQSLHLWKLHSGTTEKSYSHFETSDYRPWNSTGENTTEQIRFDVRTTDEVKPSDAGRGDIGEEESGTLVVSKEPLILASEPKPTEAKSIEGLSLTRENINHNSHKAEDKEEKDNTESIGVLSLEEQGRHGQTNLDQTRTSSSNIHIFHNQRESANNQQDQHQVQTRWSQHGNGQWQEQNNGQQLEDLGQQVETDWFKHTAQPKVNESHTGHQNTQQTQHAGGNLEDLGQQVITDWTNLEPQSQHAQNTQQTSNSRESLADFGQQRETGWKPAESLGHQSRQSSQTGYLDHQTQSTPKSIHTGENLEDLGQQVQTDWTQDENLQQQSQLTQQTSDLDLLTQHGSDDFYKQRYHEKPQERSQLNIEQAVPAKVEEATTQKPGFWKKVSTKVNGWFGKS